MTVSEIVYGTVSIWRRGVYAGGWHGWDPVLNEPAWDTTLYEFWDLIQVALPFVASGTVTVTVEDQSVADEPTDWGGVATAAADIGASILIPGYDLYRCNIEGDCGWGDWVLGVGEVAVAATGIGYVGRTILKGAAKGAKAADAAEKIPWGFWGDYAKVTVDGRTYAKVGNRLYTRHAVDRMAPSGLGRAAGGSKGRSISPNLMEDVITTGQRTDDQVDGVTRSIFRSGSVEVVTENADQTVITVNPFKY